MDALIANMVTQVKKGDQEAFEGIVDLFKDKIYRHCFRMVGNGHEAEDLAQETFLRAYRNISKYNSEYKFSTWIFRIATNLCIDRLRKKKPDYYLDAEVPGTDGATMYSQLSSEEPLPEEVVTENEEWNELQAEIMKLPEKYRTAILLKYVEDLSLEEISKIMDIPVPTVKTRIHRGREALKKVFQMVVKTR
ncbi:MAG: RNA polymerase sigma factor SigW [Bacillota bacterium]|jgi:RNA polymerase sigma-70 factor, ECF subfamily|uniref:RNA polymerase sigma factor n=1 Tax=Fictibacillus norfolkensis TaxID=2762233 RepID=A0ABR8SS92_9BACL|nr:MULTISPECIES: RNA polymerase sigma factor SigW [Fictibacillus]MBD7965939.1 RNA polymerase sigma factor SigW [Fictibacillus norfolkensis]MBH0171768.1 RNA polymerase sigma factor SigW [Fictibacillus sp. 18YEL24]MED1865554.1 RNA polymerase sigma factor SigW [Fictibacillus nanhaiensis]